MRQFRIMLKQAWKLLLVMSILCGMIYTMIVTIIGNIFLKDKVSGSIIKVNGVQYGSELLAQNFTGDSYLWGRIMLLDTQTFQNNDGENEVYANPSNLSPQSSELKKLVENRVQQILVADPETQVDQIPVDLVTCSASGLDPDISLKAAQYQITRIAKVREMSEQEVSLIIDKCTTHKILGVFGEETVNVLKVNLMLDGIL